MAEAGTNNSAAGTTTTTTNTTTTSPHTEGEDAQLIAIAESSNGSSTNNNHSNKRKADRWKHTNIHKAKKEKRRASVEKNNRRKQVYDEDTSMSPHEGSFAHETMRQLFNVTIGDDHHHAHADGEKPTSSTSNENEPVDASTATVADDNDNNNTTTVAKLPKRKLAILVSFLGTDYFGFQINPSHRTLQAELELALHKAGIISKLNFGFPNKYSWSNSARTDKGVHAAAQVCSLKGEMIFHSSSSTSNDDNDDDHDGNTNKGSGACDTDAEVAAAQKLLQLELDAMRNKVNEYLPPDVRVLDIARPTRMFCARTNRNKVRYQYMVPSYMFCSREEIRTAFANVPEDTIDTSLDENNTEVQDETMIRPEVLANARNRLVDYRVTPDQLERLQRGLKLFEGTHCFHNYTRRVGANDASSNRYILSFVPLDPILVPSQGSDTTRQEGVPSGDAALTQWIPLQVVGQSFLLNQIRKMVSAAVDFARGAVSEEAILRSLTKECRTKVNVAPAQGLFLDRSYYDLYNRQKGKTAPKTKKHDATNADRQQQQQQQPHDITLNWAEEEGQEELPPAVARIEEFKNETIIPHIVQEETNEANFVRYIHVHDRCLHEMYCAMDGSNYDNKRTRDYLASSSENA